MRRNVLIVFAIIAVSAPAAIAQEVDGSQLFPVVARTSGVGTSQWVTDLTVNNLQDEEVLVGIQFFPENRANTFDPSFPDRFPLGPRETRVIEDVLSTVFGYDSNIKGALVVVVESSFIPSNPEDARILAVTRTYNTADPAGTYGQTVPALEADTVTTIPLIATGARNDDQFRSNVGFVSLALVGDITVHYRILGPDGGELASGSRVLPSATIRQFSLNQLGVGNVDGALTVEVWLDESSVSQDPCADLANTLMAYVSKVDNGTGDAEFLYAAPLDDFSCPD
jgi:hypothetical protein